MNNIRFCTLVGLLLTKLSHYLIVLDYVHLVGLLLTKLSHYLIVLDYVHLVGLLLTKLSHYLIVLDYVHLVGLLLTKLSHYLIVYNHTNMFLAIQSDIKNRWHCLFKLGTLSNHGVNVKGNITWRYMFALFPLLRGFKNSFNLYNVAELFWNRIGRNRVQVETETEKFAVVCSRSPQNLKFSHFTLLFCRERRKNVSKIITHVQDLCFAP